MPIPLSGSTGSADAADRLPMLERELGALRRELEAVRAQSGGEHARHSWNGWLSTALAAFSLLVALAALLHGR